MESFRQVNRDNPAVAEFNIRGSHSWDEVVNVAGQAVGKYQGRSKGLRGLLPKVGRKIGEAQPAVDSYLNVLPQGDYSSIVCGAVVLICRATTRMADVRQKVLSTLSGAPELLEQTETFLGMYPNDKRLNERAIQLYIALVVLYWLDHGICKSP